MTPYAKLRSVNIRPTTEKDHENKTQIPATATNKESRKREWNIRW